MSNQFVDTTQIHVSGQIPSVVASYMTPPILSGQVFSPCTYPTPSVPPTAMSTDQLVRALVEYMLAHRVDLELTQIILNLISALAAKED